MRRLSTASCSAEQANEAEARSASPSRKRIIERQAKSVHLRRASRCHLIMTPTAVTPAPPVPPTVPHRLLHPDPVVRRLSWMVLVNTVGNGLFMAVSVLYFTRVTGLGVGRVGIGLTAAGLCG